MCIFFGFVGVLFFFPFVLMQVRWPCMKFKFGSVAINLIMHVSMYIVFVMYVSFLFAAVQIWFSILLF